MNNKVIIELENFFSQEFDFNLNSITKYNDALLKVKEKMSIDLPAIYSKTLNWTIIDGSLNCFYDGETNWETLKYNNK